MGPTMTDVLSRRDVGHLAGVIDDIVPGALIRARHINPDLVGQLPPHVEPEDLEI
jgi:hypothetical protein